MNAGEQKQAKGGGLWRTIGGVSALLAGIAVVALAIRWSDRTIDEQPQRPAVATPAVAVQEREPVSDIGDCDVALTLTAADGGRNLDLLFSARNGKWLAAGVDGRGRMNVERRTSNADRPTAAATAQAGTPMVPAGGQAGGNDGEGKTVLVRPETLMVKGGQIEGKLRLNIEQRTSNAERPTGTTDGITEGKTATAQAGTPMVPERRGTTDGVAKTLTVVTHHDYSISARVVGTTVVGSWERTMDGKTRRGTLTGRLTPVTDVVKGKPAPKTVAMWSHVTFAQAKDFSRGTGVRVVVSAQRAMPGRKVDVALKTSEGAWWVAEGAVELKGRHNEAVVKFDAFERLTRRGREGLETRAKDGARTGALGAGDLSGVVRLSVGTNGWPQQYGTGQFRVKESYLLKGEGINKAKTAASGANAPRIARAGLFSGWTASLASAPILVAQGGAGEEPLGGGSVATSPEDADECVCDMGGGPIGDPGCGAQNDANGACDGCMDCVPASMTLIVQGGEVAGTNELAFSSCGWPEGSRTVWQNGTAVSISKGASPSCGSSDEPCQSWQVNIEKGCGGYWWDTDVTSACNAASLTFVAMGAVATAGVGAPCEDGTCGGTTPATYDLTIDGMGCLDGTYQLTRNYCVNNAVSYTYFSQSFYMTLDYWAGLGWGLSVYGAPSALFQAHICRGPSGCGDGFEWVTMAGYTVDFGMPVTSMAMTPSACQPATVACEYTGDPPYQCPLCVGQGVAEPASYKAKINSIVSAFDQCPGGNWLGAHLICLYESDVQNTGTDCTMGCSPYDPWLTGATCNQDGLFSSMGARQAVVEWNWLVAANADVSLQFMTKAGFTTPPTEPLFGLLETRTCPEQPVRVEPGWGMGGSCTYRSATPVATVRLAGVDEFGNEIVAHTCYPDDVPVYLHFNLYGGEFWTYEGWPNTTYGAQLALVDANGAVWASVGVPDDGSSASSACGKSCVSKWHFCRHVEDFVCENGWGETDNCGCGFYSSPSPAFSGFDIMVEPCGPGGSPP
jgi:hypothetical protein